MGAAGFQFFAAAKCHNEFAARLRLQMTDLVKVHNRRTVDPHEAVPVQQGCEFRERHTRQQRGGLNADLHVIARGFDEIDLMFFEKKKFIVAFDHDSQHGFPLTHCGTSETHSSQLEVGTLDVFGRFSVAAGVQRRDMAGLERMLTVPQS
jgi:hypothetical protein